MSLRFIIGRAGAGKTSFCLGAAREKMLVAPEGPPLIILTPEQASFQTEYALVSSMGNDARGNDRDRVKWDVGDFITGVPPHGSGTPGATPPSAIEGVSPVSKELLNGFMRIQVLSFRRLAYRVLLEAGGAARPHIGELGKRMALRRIMLEQREQLRVFGQVCGRPGFADTMARAIGELKTYRVTPADIAAATYALNQKGRNAALESKLKDINLLYAELEEFMADRFTDPDDYLNLLAERLDSAGFIRGAEVWIDGFTGFTPQEFHVLAALLRTTERVNIALCADPATIDDEPDETDLFYPSMDTYKTISDIAKGQGVLVEPALFLNERHGGFANPAISHLEKNYFRRPAPSNNMEVNNLLLARAENRWAEVEGVAREIVGLCRDKGCRYRDILVLVRDLETYSQIISYVFSDHHIPVFIDQKRPVLSHPIVELARSALETVIRNWAFEPMFRYLKTGLTPISREEADILENYVLARGVRGNRWTEEQPWEETDQLSIDQIRRSAVSALASFDEALGGGGTVRETTEALYNLLSDLEAPLKLEEWRREAQGRGELEKAREHGQVWGMLMELLDQIVETMGSERLKPKDYAAVLDAGLEGLGLGLIPPGLDQIVAGTLDRSRNPSARACFIMGVNEGVLPARISGHGVLTDDDRESLEKVNLSLSPGAHRRVFEEQYYVYLALTRASEYLTLSYPAGDEEGGAAAPSPVIARIKELLPGVPEKEWATEPKPGGGDDLDFIVNPGRALAYLAENLREAKNGYPLNPLWRDVYNWYQRNEIWRPVCASALEGLFYQNRAEKLNPTVAEQLYGAPFRTGVTGIERFKTCPFAHFLNRGLSLKERAILKIKAPDIGQFLHAVLKLYGERLNAQGLGWGALSTEDSNRVAGEVVDYLAPRVLNEVFVGTPRQRYLTGKLKSAAQLAVSVMAEHARRGEFHPAGLELAFGLGGEWSEIAVALPGGGEMKLTGRIDRVDTAISPKGTYLRVIDYKSNRMTLNLSDIWYGLKLQLLVYLEAALIHSQELAGEQCLPGGVFYFGLENPLIETVGVTPTQEEINEIILKRKRLEGVALADPDVLRLMDRELSGASSLIPVQLKKDGNFAARSAVITEAQFDLLRTHMRRQLAGASRDILDGEVSIAPFRQGQFRPCSFCEFSPVCRFDPLLEGNTYRYLPKLQDDEVWRRIGE